MDDEIHRVSWEGEFKSCPLCGYQDGFHTMFKREGASTRWLLICPACHRVFDIDLNAGHD